MSVLGIMAPLGTEKNGTILKDNYYRISEQKKKTKNIVKVESSIRGGGFDKRTYNRAPLLVPTTPMRVPRNYVPENGRYKYYSNNYNTSKYPIKTIDRPVSNASPLFGGEK